MQYWQQAAGGLREPYVEVAIWLHGGTGIHCHGPGALQRWQRSRGKPNIQSRLKICFDSETFHKQKFCIWTAYAGIAKSDFGTCFGCTTLVDNAEATCALVLCTIFCAEINNNSNLICYATVCAYEEKSQSDENI